MKFNKLMLMAFSSIISNKMRSFLTMLGIIIGVGAVIILVSIMQGVTGKVTEIFDDFGANTIVVNVIGRGDTRQAYPKDIYQFTDSHPDLFDGVSPVVSFSGKVRAQGNSEDITTTINGVSEEYPKIELLNIPRGRFLQYFDVEKQQNVCVIGTYIEKKLFEGSDALGEAIKINGIPFTIIGVFEEKADGEERSADEVIVIPYTNATKIIGNTRVGTYVVLAKDSEKIDYAVALLRDRMEKLLGNSNYYSVVSMKDVLAQMNSILGILSTALVAIAGISLLVGGIGIMNIMLVSVTERTREIGIRKSLGAKDRTIMQQFVIEAGAVSGLGGVIGIAFGVGVASLGGMILNMKVTPSPVAIAVAFFVSVGIGIVFGFLPARKAALLNPIDALRYD